MWRRKPRALGPGVAPTAALLAVEGGSSLPAREVNASPSLTASTPADYELKFGMLDDTLSVLDLERMLPASAVVVQNDGQRRSKQRFKIYNSDRSAVSCCSRP